MFGFIKKCFFAGLTFLPSLTSVNSLSYISMNNQECNAKWKGYDNSFNSWNNKKRPCIKMSQYFTKPFKSFEDNINVKGDLSNYATKSDLKNLTHIETSIFALKTNLASLKTEVDQPDIDKLAPISVNLSQSSDVVKNDVVKKAVYDKLAAKVNNIDTSDFVLKTKYQTDKTELEKKIPDVTDFVKKTKLTELENKIPDVSSLVTKTALTTVENKIPNASSLVKKTNYDTKISELEKKLADHNHDKYITNPEFKSLAADVFNPRLAQVNLATKTDFDAKLSSLNRKITVNKSKHLLFENEIKRLNKIYLACFLGRRWCTRLFSISANVQIF